MEVILVIALISVIILLIWLYRVDLVKTALISKLKTTEWKIAKLQRELDSANVDLDQQNESLNKCRGDLTTCVGKTANTEVQITAFKATIADQLSMITSLHDRIAGCNQIAGELREAIAQMKMSKDIILELKDDIYQLDAIIESQDRIVYDLRKVITLQDLRIKSL